MATLFVSDLHLSHHRPEKFALFKALMLGPALKADAFFILGDLFDEFWIGCDDRQSINQEIISTLCNFTSQTQTPLFVMRGNRDFHLDKNFAAVTGCHLINDPHQYSLAGKKILLMHGDSLCSNDLNYQYWRKFITPVSYTHLTLPTKA